MTILNGKIHLREHQAGKNLVCFQTYPPSDTQRHWVALHLLLESPNKSKFIEKLLMIKNII